MLEIGAGAGYNAAVLAHLAGPDGRVTAVDVDADIVEQARDRLTTAGGNNVEVVLGDGALGHQPRAPYDRIIATGGAYGRAGRAAPARPARPAPAGPHPTRGQRLANSYGLLTAIRHDQRHHDLAEQYAGDVAYRPYRAGLVLLGALVAYLAFGPAPLLHLHHVSGESTWQSYLDDLTPTKRDTGWTNAADPAMTPVQAQQWQALVHALRQVTAGAAETRPPAARSHQRVAEVDRPGRPPVLSLRPHRQQPRPSTPPARRPGRQLTACHGGLCHRAYAALCLAAARTSRGAATPDDAAQLTAAPVTVHVGIRDRGWFIGPCPGHACAVAPLSSPSRLCDAAGIT